MPRTYVNKLECFQEYFLKNETAYFELHSELASRIKNVIFSVPLRLLQSSYNQCQDDDLKNILALAILSKVREDMRLNKQFFDSVQSQLTIFSNLINT